MKNENVLTVWFSIQCRFAMLWILFMKMLLQRLMACCYNGLQVERVDIRLYYWVSVPFPHIQWSLVVMCMHMCSHFQTKATDVDFWSIDAIELELMHKERIYPPRFQIHAYATRCMCTPIFFQGTAEDITVELLLKPANSGIMEKCNVCRYLYRILASINFVEIKRLLQRHSVAKISLPCNTDWF